MAISSGGSNREYHCASVVMTWSATAAATYTSTVSVPAGAQIISYSVMAGSVVPSTGTTVRIAVGGTQLGATIAFAKYDAVGEGTTLFVADGTVASSSGVISVDTTGTHDVGSTKMSVCYIV
tara:strand:- start:2667 stop:3032 length:366 start_codon:yes stop_codon:yes gene_type:complete